MRNKAKSLGIVAGAFVVFICCSESYFFASGIHIAGQPFGGLQTIPGKYLTRKIGFFAYCSSALLVEGGTTISKVGACKKAFAIKTSAGIAIYPEDDIALPCCKMLPVYPIWHLLMRLYTAVCFCRYGCAPPQYTHSCDGIHPT